MGSQRVGHDWVTSPSLSQHSVVTSTSELKAAAYSLTSSQFRQEHLSNYYTGTGRSSSFTSHNHTFHLPNEWSSCQIHLKFLLSGTNSGTIYKGCNSPKQVLRQSVGRMIQITGVRNRRQGLYKNPKLRVTNPQSYRMLGDQKHYILASVPHWSRITQGGLSPLHLWVAHAWLLRSLFQEYEIRA